MYLKGLVQFLVVSPDAAGRPKGSRTGTGTGEEGDPTWGPPPLWELLLSMLTEVLLGLTAAGVVQSHTCAAASIKQGTYVYKRTPLEELEKRNPLIT